MLNITNCIGVVAMLVASQVERRSHVVLPQPTVAKSLRALDSFQTGHFASQLVKPANQLALRCIAHVIRAAHAGDLPLFAATLGMAPSEFRPILHPDIQDLAPTFPADFLNDWLPPQFQSLSVMLAAHRSSNEPLAAWLGNAMAAACYGEQHLWQDLGLEGRDDASALMAQWFPGLFVLNSQDMKWKRFLFEQLGKRLGNPGFRPPECDHCDSFRICFSEP